MTQDELNAILKRNPALSFGDTRPTPNLERPAWDAALGASKAQEGDSSRVHLRIVSIRKRLLDPDNLSPKWLIDSLRYARLIRGDEPDKITLEVTQRKAAKGEEETVVVEVFKLTQRE